MSEESYKRWYEKIATKEVGDDDIIRVQVGFSDESEAAKMVDRMDPFMKAMVAGRNMDPIAMLAVPIWKLDLANGYPENQAVEADAEASENEKGDEDEGGDQDEDEDETEEVDEDEEDDDEEDETEEDDDVEDDDENDEDYVE